jgi:hypothetical protein
MNLRRLQFYHTVLAIIRSVFRKNPYFIENSINFHYLGEKEAFGNPDVMFQTVAHRGR